MPAAKTRAGLAAKPLTEQRLRNIAEFYVAQRESSAGMLRAVLERRLQRRLRSLAPEAAREERAEVMPLIEAEVARLQAAGLIDDARFAEMKARSGLARGRGGRRILRELGRKGVGAEVAGEGLLSAAREALGEDDDADRFEVLRGADREAALAFAEKRKLGPFRRVPLPEDRTGRMKAWRREAAAMARAGFQVDVIREVLDREPGEEA